MKTHRTPPCWRGSRSAALLAGALALWSCAAPADSQTPPAPVPAPESGAPPAPPAPAPQKPEPAPQAPSAPSGPATAPPAAPVMQPKRAPIPADYEKTAEEAELANKVLELMALVPEDVRKPAGLSIEELHQLVDDLLRLGKAYLERFPEGSARREMLFPVARTLILNHSRAMLAESQRIERETGRTPELGAIERVRKKYFEDVIRIVDQGIAEFPDGERHREFWKLRGTATFFSQRYAESAEAYRIVLARFPDDPKTPESLIALLNAYLHDRKYDEALVVADQFIQRFPRDDLLPHVLQLKAKGLTEAGRAEDALAWWLSIGDLLKKGAAGDPVELADGPHRWTGEAQAAFQRYLDESRFMIGYLHFVQGRYEEARAALEDAMVELTQLQSQSRIDPRSQVFLDRTRKTLEVIVQLVSNPAPELTISHWLDDVPLDPRAELGNVVVLLFAPFENPRYEDVQGTLQALTAELWPEGLRVGWIADPKGFNDIPSKLARLDVQRRRLGLSYPVGVESELEWPNFRRFQASVGGASIVLLDRAGKIAWFDLDPTFRAERLMRQVIDRLLAAPKPAGG